MRRFGDLNARAVERVARIDETLAMDLAQLAQSYPGNAGVIAAAGIKARAQLSRSASMVELGNAAVDALRRAGWTLTPPAAAPVSRETSPGPTAAPTTQQVRESRMHHDIPDDWTA